MNQQELISRAEERLNEAHSFDPKELVFLHTAVSAGVILLLALCSFGLDRAIQGTGGLSGIGLRAVLGTAQSVLEFVQAFLLPFWAAGYTYAAMKLARGQEAGPGSLLGGFRSFGAVAGTLIFSYLRYLLIGIAVSYGSIMLLTFTPLASGITEIAMGLVASGATEIDEATLTEITAAGMPLILATMAISCTVTFIYSYCLRFAMFAALDNPKAGGRRAVRKSVRMLKGHKKELFLLDLHFWWYYLASAVLMAVAYGDVLLGYLGITLPFDYTLSYFLFYILYFVGQIALFTFAKNRVTVSYVLFYDGLEQPKEEKPSPFPWNQPTVTE